MTAQRLFMCAVCLGPIPVERDDTVVWQDVRFPVQPKPGLSGKMGYGPFLTAHPECFQSVQVWLNRPCLHCGHALAPIPSVVAGKGRWACGGCKQEYEAGPDGALFEVLPRTDSPRAPGT